MSTHCTRLVHDFSYHGQIQGERTARAEATTFTMSAGRQVILTNGPKASNVFWQVGSSATLGTTTLFKGNIMAYQAVTLKTGAKLEGGALARVAAVALDTNTVTRP
ncbi:MAG: ice-binding family protein [Byssovorax sp.]